MGGVHSKPKKKLNREADRLLTFNKWIHDFIDVEILSRTGFFYTGFEDLVECYFCKIKLGCWEPDDDPVYEHLK